MFLRVDNNDGIGELDYTCAVSADAPITLHRARGQWATCMAGLTLTESELTMPQSRSHVRVLDAEGRLLFQGVVEATPCPVSVLADDSGIGDCMMMRAVETAWLTQTQASDALQSATATQHTMPLEDVRLSMDRMQSPSADLAVDVTVSGNHEPTQYVTELFRGDGATERFVLQHAPFREAGNETLLDDAFDGNTFNTNTWARVDTGSYLSLGSGGLHLGGGTGFDGATVLRFNETVELGGSLIATASNVTLTPGSDGVLLGLYDGLVSLAQCTAGVRVRGTAGLHSLVAIVNGVEQSTSYDFAAGHSYTLRVRVHCAEMQRIRNRYSAVVDGVLQQFGGDAVDAPIHIVIEAVDLGLASSTLPTVLYDGEIAVSPLQCVFAPVNSVQLSGSVGRVTLQQTGSCIVVTTAADGTTRTRRQGASDSGADYSLSSSATVAFAAGLLPQPGDLVTVRYRRDAPSVARATDDTAEYLKVAFGLPGVPSWAGKVTSPLARSSVDCLSAAKALLALGTGAATGISGSATWLRGTATSDDVQPQDALLLSSGEGTQILPVQSVRMVDGNCEPEQVTYTVEFAQNRETSLDFRTEMGLAADLAGAVAVTTNSVLPASLSGLQITVASTTSLQVDVGVDAPNGYGFEVRRSDANFGSTSTTDLVLRSAVRSFSIPRVAFNERFFVRMYDNAVPPKYSALSSVVLTSLPVA